MIDKEAQRARAAQFDFEMLAKGISKPAPLPVPVSKTLKIDSKPVPAPKQKAVKKPKYLLEPFTNSEGQTIQVGAKIVAIRQGYNHSIKVGLGTYLGLRRDSQHRVTSVTVLVSEWRGGWYSPTGEKTLYGTPRAKYEQKIEDRKVTLPSKRIYPTI